MGILENKKGSGLDLVYIIVGFFTICIIGILISAIISRFNTELNKIDSDVMPTEAKDAATTFSGVLPGTLNGGMLFLFFGACFVALILASMTIFHPAFFVFFLLELGITIIIGAGLADAFQVFIETPALATEYAQYSTIIFLFQYLPFIVGVIGCILAAIMYKVRANA